MPSQKLHSNVNQLRAYIVRLKQSLKLRDVKVARLEAELNEERAERGVAQETVVALSSVAQELDAALAELAKMQERPCD